MKLKNKPTASGNDSFQQPPAGKALLILRGFADIGLQPGGQFDPSHQVLLRWELHNRKGPMVDGEGRIYTINKSFSATVRGDKSNLAKCLRAHGIQIGVNEETDSREWLGCAAWAVIQTAISKKKQKEYSFIANDGFSLFDPEVDGMALPDPVLPEDHWEPDDQTQAPLWAHYWVDEALDATNEYGSAYKPPKDSSDKKEVVTSPPSDEADGSDDKIPF